MNAKRLCKQDAAADTTAVEAVTETNTQNVLATEASATAQGSVKKEAATSCVDHKCITNVGEVEATRQAGETQGARRHDQAMKPNVQHKRRR